MKRRVVYVILLFGLLSGVIVSCQKTSTDLTLITADVTFKSFAGGISGGSIIAGQTTAITQKGICWSTLPQPTINDNSTNEGTGSEEFSSELTNLNPGTEYYIRSYAVTENKIFYGNQLIFLTEDCTEELAVYYNEGPCDNDFIETSSGTAGCLDGPKNASPGETIDFEISTNIADGDIRWIVSNGISIVSGQGASMATLNFSEGFSGGCVYVRVIGADRSLQTGYWLGKQ